MYKAAIRAITNNFHTFSTFNRENGGSASKLFKEKGVAPQYFATACRKILMLMLGKVIVIEEVL